MTKKIFALMLIVAFMVSCSKKADYVVISGKISLNEKLDKIDVLGYDFKKEIKLGEDGSFSDTLNIKYDGVYQFMDEYIYLKKGKSLSINLSEDYTEGQKVSFSGDLATENKFMSDFSLLRREYLIEKKIINLDEVPFLEKVKEFAKKTNDLFEKTKFTDKDFEMNFKSTLPLEEYCLYMYYDMYHVYSLNGKEFKVSNEFPKYLDKIDFDNPTFYDYSITYRELVKMNLENSTIGVKNFEDVNKILLENYNKIKSQNIKNGLAEDLATTLITANSKNVKESYDGIIKNVTDPDIKKIIDEKYSKIDTLSDGKLSPKFTGYENFNGGTSSLDDFKGKYVYIDLWATWCSPCRAEIPSLKKLEQTYKDKNIEFISISVDKDKDAWLKFVKENDLKGVQLHADKDFESQFVKDYDVVGIPRFILIDKEGKIILSDAPRPSDAALIEEFKKLDL